MISHVHIGITDLDRAFDFYAPMLAALGLTLKFREDEAGWAGWMMTGKTRPLFVIGKAFNGQPASPGNGQMVAILAKNREMVRQCYKIALANGASPDGEPSLRPQYHQHYYGAYFFDLDSNKICICCHDPE